MSAFELHFFGSKFTGSEMSLREKLSHSSRKYNTPRAIYCHFKLGVKSNKSARENETYHIDDLHQRQPEAQLQWIRFVDDRTLQHVVVIEQIVQETFLVVTGIDDCERESRKKGALIRISSSFTLPRL